MSAFFMIMHSVTAVARQPSSQKFSPDSRLHLPVALRVIRTSTRVFHVCIHSENFSESSV